MNRNEEMAKYLVKTHQKKLIDIVADLAEHFTHGEEITLNNSFGSITVKIHDLTPKKEENEEKKSDGISEEVIEEAQEVSEENEEKSKEQKAEEVEEKNEAETAPSQEMAN